MFNCSSCFQRDLSSAEDLAAVRTAIELCHSNELKKEILLAPGSEYERNISRYDTNRSRRMKWKEMLESKATTTLADLGLRRVQIEKVTGLVISIGVRMLMWAKYHEGILGLSRDYSIQFLNSSFYSPLGTIDNKKAAAVLMEDRGLSIKQKYTTACLYCLTEHIPDLFMQMSQEEKENRGKETKCPEIVTFWTDYLMGEIDELTGEKPLAQYMLEKAIESGSKAAVEYCLKETSLSRKKEAVIEAALKTVRKTPETDYDWTLFSEGFGCYTQNGRLKSIPEDYFVDILCSLISKTSEEEMIEFLKQDIEDSQIFSHPRSRVFEIFLDWPHQNYFVKAAKLTWKFLPERTYAYLLFKICEKINPRVTDFKRGEEKSYDYQKLLKEFWIQSPDRYKRFVFRDRESMCLNRREEVLNKDERLLIVRLLTLKSGIYEDTKVVQLIWNSATDQEKGRIIGSKEWKDIFFALLEGQKWEILDEYLSEYIFSEEQAVAFKRTLFFSEEGQNVFAYFIKYNLDAAEFFTKWSCLDKEEIVRCKMKSICSEDGRNACRDLFLHEGGEIANRFCEWCFSFGEDIRKFKDALIFSVGLESCADLIMKDQLEVVDEFIKWSHLSEDGIREFKNRMQDEKGSYICGTLISGHGSRRVQFQGGKWALVEKFLTWCFSSEEEIADFKKDRLLKISGAEIHFRLIQSNQWDEAESFFAWLALSDKEIKELKKETLFNHQETYVMLLSLVCVRKANVFFSDYGIRENAIALLLRWFLTDKETVLEFRGHFNKKYSWLQLSEEDRAALKDLNSAIEQRLSELDKEQRGTKRKSELSNDLCNVELKKK